jgi:hypothetical protein
MLCFGVWMKNEQGQLQMQIQGSFVQDDDFKTSNCNCKSRSPTGMTNKESNGNNNGNYKGSRQCGQ